MRLGPSCAILGWLSSEKIDDTCTIVAPCKVSKCYAVTGQTLNLILDGCYLAVEVTDDHSIDKKC